MAAMNEYRALSKIYRQLANKRQHFEKQCLVLKLLFHEYSVSKDARILDAACGTGDVITSIYEHGYTGVHAVDGSPQQLSQLEQEQPSFPLRQSDWMDLTSVFRDWGEFDFVYFLGHSLPHLHRDSLPLLFQSVFNGLRNGGVLAFDIRPWAILQDGTITQFGREEGVTRYLGVYIVDGAEYRLFEEVSYSDSVQQVKYQLVPESDGASTICETLTYHMYHWKDVMSLLEEAGFEVGSHKVYEIPEWPYLVVTARKQV